METYSRVAVVVLGFLLATAAGTPVVRGFFRLVDWQTRREAQRREAAEEGEGGPELIDLRLVRAGKELPGGRWIGLLERAATYACIVAGFPAGIAVVMVVKGFGRYPELRTPDTAKGERFIIGTLASLLWASLWAGLVLLLRVHLKIG